MSWDFWKECPVPKVIKKKRTCLVGGPACCKTIYGDSSDRICNVCKRNNFLLENSEYARTENKRKPGEAYKK